MRLRLKPEFIELVRSGRKRSTVRAGQRAVSPGSGEIISAHDVIPIRITDATNTGTFGEIEESIFKDKDAFKWFKKHSAKFARSVNVSTDDDIKLGRLRFELKLTTDVFKDLRLGLQKLVHVLASDLFERRIDGLDGLVEVDDIDLGNLVSIFKDHYRPKSHSIQAIRAAFSLEKDEPLLAFTIKPRTGLTLDDYQHFAQEVFRGGFHLVEMDTRDLDLMGPDRAALVDAMTTLAIKESKGGRVHRFSVNVSGPAYTVKDTIERISSTHKTLGAEAWVIKIDGNLDGLSTIQAIRNDYAHLHSQPIITCYPVLKYALQRFLGEDAFVHLLGLAGADVIYPGKRPRFSADKAIDGSQLAASQRHYSRMRHDDYPLLTVAGGILIGHVHALMALLGPNIGFFVGGGLSLSKEGLRAAAENFKKAVDLARPTLSQSTWSRSKFDSEFGPLTKVYSSSSVVAPSFEYINPCKLVDTNILHEREIVP
jgi:ribulose 1,5-bisphosphate carboxylase large subunit-like protein